MQGRVARFTLEGVSDATVSVHPYTSEDGLGLELRRFHQADCDDVVLLVHGLTSSSDMFSMPEHRNLVSFLHESGFTDVWTWLSPEPARFTNRDELEAFLATVVLRTHVDGMDARQRAGFVRAVAERLPHGQIDYVRLNILARRAA